MQSFPWEGPSRRSQSLDGAIQRGATSLSCLAPNSRHPQISFDELLQTGFRDRDRADARVIRIGFAAADFTRSAAFGGLSGRFELGRARQVSPGVNVPTTLITGSATRDSDRATNAHFRSDKPRGATGKSLIVLNPWLTLNQRVPGSSPGAPTKQINTLAAMHIGTDLSV